ncbi:MULTISPECIES: SRPBCC family protein [unclassified Streptomyces]|uniref:SRPBCC family protein n=1 Tax=unclassified Streptomyces TaxID=2593676 RepID=UPI00332652AF
MRRHRRRGSITGAPAPTDTPAPTRKDRGTMPTDLTGTYRALDDGRCALRFGRVYDRPVEHVWRFVTDPGELWRWFPCPAEMELRPGGTVRFGADPARPGATGEVNAADPPRHVSFTWGPDELRFDLEPLAEVGTRFTFTDILGVPDTAARTAAGWEVCLTCLDALARGEHPTGPPTRPTPLWRRYYDGYVGAGLPSGAAVPDPD